MLVKTNDTQETLDFLSSLRQNMTSTDKSRPTRQNVVPPSRSNENVLKGKGYRFYQQSSVQMAQCADSSITLTITSPPYWNAIDYHKHARQAQKTWYRKRDYQKFGATFDEYLENISKVFQEVLRVTKEGGFCALVVGTILHKGRHYPIPMLITEHMLQIGWEFHQDIIWNKVTGGVKRAGVFIQHPKPGYYYPNIMTEYILIFRKPGKHWHGTQEALKIDELFTCDIANNIWHIAPVPPKVLDHPCPYPEELVRRLVVLYSQQGDEILDPFLGSGQTAIVAVREGRTCVGYDIEKKYLQLSKTRMNLSPLPRQCHLIPRFQRLTNQEF